MGNSGSAHSIVARWNNSDHLVSYSGTKCDVIELRTNKKMVIKGVGLVKAAGANAHATVEIINQRDGEVISSSRFEVRPDSSENNQIKLLDNEMTLQPGTIYKIMVVYEGAGCCTYADTLPVIKDDDHEVSIRRDLDASTKNLNRQFNLITDLMFERYDRRGLFCV